MEKTLKKLIGIVMIITLVFSGVSIKAVLADNDIGNPEISDGINNTIITSNSDFIAYKYVATETARKSVTVNAPDLIDGYVEMHLLDSEGIAIDQKNSDPIGIEAYVNIDFVKDVVYYVAIKLHSDEDKDYKTSITIGAKKSYAMPVLVDDTNSAFDIVGKDDNKGLSWDCYTNTLTLKNWNASMMTLYFDTTKSSSDISYPEDRAETVYINVKGVNNLTDFTVVVLANISVVFIGDGELNITQENTYREAIGYYGLDIQIAERIVIDGPNINIKGSFYYDIISAKDVEIKSGAVYMDIYPYCYKSSDGTAYIVHYGDIYGDETFKMSGGTLIFKYNDYVDDKEGLENKYSFHSIEAGKVEITGGTIIVTGNKEVVDALGEPVDLSAEAAYDFPPTVKVLMGETISITSLKLSLSQTKFVYDGKAKKPKVYLEGLKEGRDFKVTYTNNVKIGKATVKVDGVGNFVGSLTTTFSIVADGPAKGTTVKDKKYIYKVTKSGNKDGSVLGELAVTGLKKKSLKTIKIAAKVKINGVNYKVTSIAKNAFKGNKKIKKALIGKNIKSIGKSAFAGDKKLKKVIIKSKKLKKVGKKAFKSVKKSAVIKVPKAKKKAYKKLFKKSGCKARVK